MYVCGLFLQNRKLETSERQNWTRRIKRVSMHQDLQCETSPKHHIFEHMMLAKDAENEIKNNIFSLLKPEKGGTTMPKNRYKSIARRQHRGGVVVVVCVCVRVPKQQFRRFNFHFFESIIRENKSDKPNKSPEWACQMQLIFDAIKPSLS